MNLTPHQLEAVSADGPFRDTCIVAGPGSGKTTVLIERYRRLVEAGIPPSRILAITFTEKATAQMKRRLAEAFAGRPELRREIERAPVSTVHGFCAGLLREHAIAAGIDPEFTVLDEQQAGAVEREAAAAALDRFFAAEPEAVRALLGAIETQDFRGALLDVRDAMRAAGAAPEADAADAEPLIDAMRRHAVEIRAERVTAWTSNQRTKYAEVGEWLDDLDRLPRRTPIEQVRILSSFQKWKGGMKLGTAARERVAEMQDTLVPAALAAAVAAHYSRERETLLGALAAIDREHTARKRAIAALDFSDLEEQTVRLLRSDERARDAVRGSFDQVLMDEFQDTNGMQAALVDLIRPPGRFYAVGDINQSIYGFRHADPEVFARYRDAAERVVDLRDNFRSRAEILRAVEAVAEGAAGIDPHRLYAGRAFAPDARPAVEVIACENEDSDCALALEAQWVARRARELREELSIGFSEIAILFRASTTMPEFARALEAEGVPYAISAAKGFFENQEVRDLVHLIRVLANPLDEISFAAVARSPLAGASDADLTRWKLMSTEIPAMRPLLDLRARRHEVALDRLLRQALDESGYGARLSVRGRLNVEKLLDLVRALSRRLSLDQLPDEFDLMRMSDPREADAQPDELGDRVRLQTIHSAKGLEFPVVFLPVLTRKGRSDSPEILFEPSAGLGIKWRNPAGRGGVSDSLHLRGKEIATAKAKKETDRLLYVAMTRAEQRLVLSWSGSGKAGEWAGTVMAKLALNAISGDQTAAAPHGESFTVRTLFTAAAPEPIAPLAIAGASLRPEIVPPAVARAASESSASVTEVADFAACPRRYWLSRGAAAGTESVAAGLGSLVHRELAGSATGDPEAEALAARFAESELGQRALSTLIVEREFDVEFAVDDVVLRGTIDLWFEDRELVIVDYKTSAAMREEYAAQLQLYTIALSRIKQRPVDRAYVSLLRGPEAVEVEAGGGEAIVRQFREAHERGDFPLREGERCARCPHFRGACPSGYHAGE